jgi:DNA-binding NtrC family response regulator
MNTRCKILVVDDLPDWRMTLSGLLVEEGYEARAAGSVAEAIKLLEANHFDLALLDVRLDESDENNTEGLDLAAEIKRRWPEVKTVIITGYGTPDTARRAMEPDKHGKRLVQDFIEKTQTDTLGQVVKRVLAQ